VGADLLLESKLSIQVEDISVRSHSLTNEGNRRCSLRVDRRSVLGLYESNYRARPGTVGVVSYKPHSFEDFEEGQTFETPGRTLSQAFVDQYAMVSGDWAEHHTNQEYAEDELYGDRIAHGFLVFTVGTGLLYQTGVFSRTLTAVTEVSVKFPNPTYVGNTISGEFEITKTSEEAPFESVGTVGIKGKLTNQDDMLVCLAEAEFLVKRN
jgi:acyl dehydratase